MPSERALETLASLPGVALWLSAGAGTGYWEWLLQQRGAAVLPFDANQSYRPEQRFCDIVTAGPELLRAYTETTPTGQHDDRQHDDRQHDDRQRDHTVQPSDHSPHTRVGLLLAWPDISEDSDFGLRCLQHFSGRYVAHVGELFGETCSANAWGQSTARACQQALGLAFRIVHRVPLPRWPGQCDALTLWQRCDPPTSCDGAAFVHLEPIAGAGAGVAAS